MTCAIVRTGGGNAKRLESLGRDDQRTVGVIVGFCTIGLLMTAAVIHLVANFGEIFISLDPMR
jgi:hypothetical protein